MESELLKIFDEDRREIGVATREEVHKAGYWHEVFHCWFISNENGNDYIFLQKRSPAKENYPNLFDITAAGHLLAAETAEDGVREVEEELGIQVPFAGLDYLGVIAYTIKEENMIDRELAHVFLYKFEGSIEQFSLQAEEVSGMVKMEFADFAGLMSGKLESAGISGFEIDESENKIFVECSVGKDMFVAHQGDYYEKVIGKIKEKL